MTAERSFFPILGPATNLKIRKDLIEQHSPPDILLYGIVKPEDIDKLFKMYARFNSLCLSGSN